jgi:hypothetical protein
VFVKTKDGGELIREFAGEHDGHIQLLGIGLSKTPIDIPSDQIETIMPIVGWSRA